MDRVNLSEKERRFLIAAALSGDSSIKELAEKLDMREHAVRYIQDSLLERGVIRPLYHVHYFKLGFSDFGIYLSRSSETSSSRQRFEQVMEKFKAVFWLAKTGGAYQYALSFLTEKPYELDDLFSKIRPTDTGVHFEKSMVLRLDWSIFAPTYLLPEPGKRPCVTISTKDPQFELDDVDRKILCALSEHPGKTTAEIARILGMKASSVAYRFEQFRKNEVIKVKRFMLDTTKAGVLNHRILIVDRGLTPKQQAEFMELCRNHHNVMALLRCTGNWDFELRLEAESPLFIDQFCQLLYDTFGSAIGAIKTMQQLSVLKHVSFPW